MDSGLKPLLILCVVMFFVIIIPPKGESVFNKTTITWHGATSTQGLNSDNVNVCRDGVIVSFGKNRFFELELVFVPDNCYTDNHTAIVSINIHEYG